MNVFDYVNSATSQTTPPTGTDQGDNLSLPELERLNDGQVEYGMNNGYIAPTTDSIDTINQGIQEASTTPQTTPPTTSYISSPTDTTMSPAQVTEYIRNNHESMGISIPPGEQGEAYYNYLNDYLSRDPLALAEYNQRITEGRNFQTSINTPSFDDSGLDGISDPGRSSSISHVSTTPSNSTTSNNSTTTSNSSTSENITTTTNEISNQQNENSLTLNNYTATVDGDIFSANYDIIRDIITKLNAINNDIDNNILLNLQGNIDAIRGTSGFENTDSYNLFTYNTVCENLFEFQDEITLMAQQYGAAGNLIEEYDSMTSGEQQRIYQSLGIATGAGYTLTETGWICGVLLDPYRLSQELGYPMGTRRNVVAYLENIGYDVSGLENINRMSDQEIIDWVQAHYGLSPAEINAIQYLNDSSVTDLATVTQALISEGSMNYQIANEAARSLTSTYGLIRMTGSDDAITSYSVPVNMQIRDRETGEYELNDIGLGGDNIGDPLIASTIISHNVIKNAAKYEGSDISNLSSEDDSSNDNANNNDNGNSNGNENSNNNGNSNGNGNSNNNSNSNGNGNSNNNSNSNGNGNSNNNGNSNGNSNGNGTNNNSVDTTPQTTPQTVPSTSAPVEYRQESQTTPQTQPQTQPKTQPKTTPQTQPKTNPQTQPKTQPQTNPQTQPQTQPAPSNRPSGGGSNRGGYYNPETNTATVETTPPTEVKLDGLTDDVIKGGTKYTTPLSSKPVTNSTTTQKSGNSVIPVLAGLSAAAAAGIGAKAYLDRKDNSDNENSSEFKTEDWSKDSDANIEYVEPTEQEETLDFDDDYDTYETEETEKYGAKTHQELEDLE